MTDDFHEAYRMAQAFCDAGYAIFLSRIPMWQRLLRLLRMRVDRAPRLSSSGSRSISICRESDQELRRAVSFLRL